MHTRFYWELSVSFQFSFNLAHPMENILFIIVIATVFNASDKTNENEMKLFFEKKKKESQWIEWILWKFAVLNRRLAIFKILNFHSLSHILFAHTTQTHNLFTLFCLCTLKELESFQFLFWRVIYSRGKKMVMQYKHHYKMCIAWYIRWCEWAFIGTESSLNHILLIDF